MYSRRVDKAYSGDWPCTDLINKRNSPQVWHSQDDILVRNEQKIPASVLIHALLLDADHKPQPSLLLL
jgi:hypothetical protein